MDQLQITPTVLGPNETAKISAVVRNTGQRAGAEVVQLYISSPPSPVKRPEKQLVGFQRVELEPGAHATVVFELPFFEQAFWYWDEESRCFVLQPGTAKIHLGNSSANLSLTGELTLKTSDKLPSETRLLSSVAVKSDVI
jgi:hypothetical protein